MLLLLLLSFLAISSVLAVCPCGRNIIGGVGCVACRLSGTVRLSLNRSTADCELTFPNTITTNPCLLTLPDGTTTVTGSLLCTIQKCPLTSIEAGIVRSADCKCSRLSPISFQFETGADGSLCQSYVRSVESDSGCSRGGLAYCVYPQISDDSIPGLTSTNVYTLSGTTLLATPATPFISGSCPLVDGLTAAASVCLASTSTPVPDSADLASVMAQNFSCPLGNVKRIVNTDVGCYRTTSGPVNACATGTIATCFYEVPKCRT